jgi:hypothetical protein
MTHVTCPGCQLRFAPAAAAPLQRCPFCGGSLATVAGQHTVGYQLVDVVVGLGALPQAVAPQAIAPPRPHPSHRTGPFLT